MKTKIDAILIACALPITANAGDTLVIIDGVCVAVRPAAAVPAPTKPAKAKGNADVIPLFPQSKRVQQRAAMARLEADILRNLAIGPMNVRNLGLELKLSEIETKNNIFLNSNPKPIKEAWAILE